MATGSPFLTRYKVVESHNLISIGGGRVARWGVDIIVLEVASLCQGKAPAPPPRAGLMSVLPEMIQELSCFMPACMESPSAVNVLWWKSHAPFPEFDS